MYDIVIAFDLETSGFSPNKHSVIEMGAVKYDCLLEETTVFESLLKFTGKLSEEVKNLTGIDEQMLKNAPTAAEAILLFVQFCQMAEKDLRILFVGHNIRDFDLPFINRLLKAHGHALIQKKDCWDTMLQTRAEIKRKRGRTWFTTQSEALTYRTKEKVNMKAACLRYGVVQNLPAHRALPDALATMGMFLVQMKKNKWAIL